MININDNVREEMKQIMKTNIKIIRQILELENKSLSELRQIYNDLFIKPCSPNAGKDQLYHKIAYRLQELSIGVLDIETKDKLDALAKGRATVSKKSKNSDFLTGTKICREYKGAIHQVEVIENGFQYNGQKWKSLSAIATKITGTKWNGPKFFQVRA